jgi:hypothetical protein
VDLLCVLLLLVAAVVAVSGGFRMRVGSVRFAITSPYRTLLWPLVLVLVRHALVPRPPIYRDLPARLRRQLATPEARSALTAMAGTRPAILFIGYLAVFTLGFNNGVAPFRLVPNEAANLQVRWDMPWYFGIAVEGYRYERGQAARQQNIVFFPAFPMLMRMAGRLLGGASTAYVLGGTLVVFAAFFWALVYLFRLARDLTGDEEAARGAVWFVAAYPFAVFFSALYTESIFLLGAVGAFYHFRRREFTRAAVWGLLVGLTRPNGCFLSVPLGMLAADSWWAARSRLDLPGGSTTPGQHIASHWSGTLTAVGAAAMPGVGALLYSAFIWNLTGQPLAWVQGQAAWGRDYDGLAILLKDRYTWIADQGLYAYTSQLPLDLLNGLGAGFVILAAYPIARRVGVAYAVFVLTNILPPLAAGGLLSAGRLSSVLFPAFIWLGAAVPARHRPGWLVSLMAVQSLNAALFYTWRPLY